MTRHCLALALSLAIAAPQNILAAITPSGGGGPIGRIRFTVSPSESLPLNIVPGRLSLLQILPGVAAKSLLVDVLGSDRTQHIDGLQKLATDIARLESEHEITTHAQLIATLASLPPESDKARHLQPLADQLDSALPGLHQEGTSEEEWLTEREQRLREASRSWAQALLDLVQSDRYFEREDDWAQAHRWFEDNRHRASPYMLPADRSRLDDTHRRLQNWHGLRGALTSLAGSPQGAPQAPAKSGVAAPISDLILPPPSSERSSRHEEELDQFLNRQMRLPPEDWSRLQKLGIALNLPSDESAPSRSIRLKDFIQRPLLDSEQSLQVSRLDRRSFVYKIALGRRWDSLTLIILRRHPQEDRPGKTTFMLTIDGGAHLFELEEATDTRLESADFAHWSPSLGAESTRDWFHQLGAQLPGQADVAHRFSPQEQADLRALLGRRIQLTIDVRDVTDHLDAPENLFAGDVVILQSPHDESKPLDSWGRFIKDPIIRLTSSIGKTIVHRLGPGSLRLVHATEQEFIFKASDGSAELRIGRKDVDLPLASGQLFLEKEGIRHLIFLKNVL